MDCRSGRSRRTFAPLLLALALGASAAAPSPLETAWRDARLAIEQADLPRAERTIGEALRRAGKSDDDWVYALRMLRGNVLARQSRVPEALAELEPELPKRLRKSEINVRRLLALAMLSYYFTHQPTKAEELLAEARRVASTTAPGALAEVLLARSNFTKSESDIRAAAQAAKRAGDELMAAKAEAALVFNRASTGHFSDAVQLTNRVLPRLERLGLKATACSTSGNLGWSYLELGDYDSAQELLTRAAGCATESERRIVLNQLGNIHFVRRDWTNAARVYQQVIDITRKDKHREFGYALANLARVNVELGRYDDARRAVTEAIAFEQEEGADTLRMSIVTARIDAATGRANVAESTLKKIIGETREPDVRFEAQARLAQIYAALKRDAPAEQYFRSATDAARDARKLVTDAELRFSFFNTVSDVFGDYVDFLVSRGRVEDALAVTETSRAQTLEEGLGITTTAQKLDPRAVAKRNGATILYYWLGRRRSYVWTITANDVRVAALPPDREIEAAVQRYAERLLGTQGTLKMTGADGQALYRMLVAPASAALAPNARVVVIADGKLHALNFETLVTPKQRYWIEDAIIVNAGSLTLLSRRDEKRSNAPAMLLVGNPPIADPSFPPLKRAGEEIRNVASHFEKRTVLEKSKATPAAYRAAAPEKFDYVHFVAHGVATRNRPLDSAVILGPDATAGYRLFARDVIKQPLRARLVTISSCHGAGTRTYAGEGLVGLAWAFLRAGAGQVIAALWEVSDSATPELMDKMYAEIRAGRDAAVALRDAKLSLLRSKTAYSRPRYWAPFVLYAGS